MSIVTDALNRVQAERARPTQSPEAPSAPESSAPPVSPPSSKSPLLTPQPPSKTIRNILRWSLIIVGVGAVGIGAYLWGLTLMPDVARVSPEHDVIPERVSEVLSEDQVPSQVAEVLPLQPQEADTAEAISLSAEESTGSELTKTEATSDILPMAQPSDSPKPLVAQGAPLEENPRKASEKLAASVTPTTVTPQVKKPSREAAIITAETQPPLSPGEPQSSIPNSQANLPTRSGPPTPQISRHATKTEAKLIQAKYLIKKRRYQHAMIILKPLFVTPPDTWEPWFWLGTAQLGLEQFEEAEESLIEGLSRNAAIPHLWVQRALVSQQQGLYGEAVEALRQAELIAPDLPEVQLNLAFSLEAQGHIANAMQHYHTFLTITEGMKSYQSARKKVVDRIIRLENT